MAIQQPTARQRNNSAKNQLQSLTTPERETRTHRGEARAG